MKYFDFHEVYGQPEDKVKFGLFQVNQKLADTVDKHDEGPKEDD